MKVFGLPQKSACTPCSHFFFSAAVAAMDVRCPALLQLNVLRELCLKYGRRYSCPMPHDISMLAHALLIQIQRGEQLHDGVQVKTACQHLQNSTFIICLIINDLQHADN